MEAKPTPFPPMNTTILFPPPPPALKLTRPAADKWIAALTEERRRLHEDQEALREREQNLRNYEARLRVLQEEIETGRAVAPATDFPFRPASQVPFNDAAALQASWEKLHRARELLEAEQVHLREDRLVLREQETVLKRREAAVAAREAQLAEREAGAPGAMAAGEPIAGEHTMSVVTRLTRGPFGLARSVFGGRK